MSTYTYMCICIIHMLAQYLCTMHRLQFQYDIRVIILCLLPLYDLSAIYLCGCMLRLNCNDHKYRLVLLTKSDSAGAKL